MTHASDRFTALPDEQTLAATVLALEEHGFSVEVADDLEAARKAVLARIPEGSSVMTNTSVTLADTGMASGQVQGTPTLFIDGFVYRGGYDAAALLAALAG